MTKQENFIEVLAKICVPLYKNREKWVLPSLCIAQAALESGWNLNAKSLFGIKGNGQVLQTTEFQNGKYVTIQDSFRTYPNITSSVIGYYDFITTTPRYEKVVNNPDFKSALEGLIYTVDGLPYATDPNYIEKILTIYNVYSLRKFDIIEKVNKTHEEIANEVIKGLWGNGEERKKKLTESGYDYATIQEIVNKKLSAVNKTNEEIANEVIKGLWGNGEERKKKLTENGYDYSTIQEIVNKKLGY